jgi:uncharacterized protein YkwD
MRAADIFRQYRKKLNPPYVTSDLLVLATTLLLLLVIPLTVISTQQRKVFTGRAEIDSPGLVKLINDYRASRGLVRLSEDKNLVDAACWMAKDMANKNYFSHTDSLGRDPFVRLSDFGVGGSFWRGENLAAGSTTAQQTFNLWKNSPGHNDVMLNSNFRRIGVGLHYHSASTFGWYWAADFASGSANTSINQCGGDLKLNSLLSKDTSGNNETKFEPGETVNVRIGVKNNGPGVVTKTFYTYYRVSTNLHPCNPAGYQQRWSSASLAIGASRTYNGSFTAPSNPGTYTIRAYTDMLCNIQEVDERESSNAKNITFTVERPDTTNPTVSITSPANGATVSGTVNVIASATDNVGVTKVEFRVDGILKRTDTAAPYTFSWDTSTVSNGSHALQARAYDAAGNIGTSPTVIVTVDNQTGKTGDLNGDGIVNIFDLSILLSNWNASGGVADLNGDSKVDIFDLSILLSNWDG